MLFVYNTHPLVLLRSVKDLSVREQRKTAINLLRGDGSAQIEAAKVVVGLGLATSEWYQCQCGACDPEIRLTFK